MASTPEDRLTGGALAAAISTAVVRIMSEHTGRGPTKARTSIADDLIVVVLQGTLTQAERSLEAAGESESVLKTRALHQQTMRSDLVAAVERLSDRTVLACMSANHLEPDIAAEIFVLAPERQSVSLSRRA